MISPDREIGHISADAIQDQERAKRARKKTANTPPLIFTDSTAVEDVLKSPDRATRWVGRLAEKPKTPAGKIAETLITNNGALIKETLVEKTGLPDDAVEHTLVAFGGLFVEQKGVVIAAPLNPKLPDSAEIYSRDAKNPELAIAS